MQLFDFVHDTFGVCFWTAPSVIIALGMVVTGLVHGHKQKKRDKDFEEQLEEKLKELNPAAASAAGTGRR